MNSYLLRVEGVNLGAFVYDTKDLSTIRGGGLLLLNAAGEVAQLLKHEGIQFETLVESASIGLFTLTTDRDSETVRQAIDAGLSHSLPHATFVVDICSGDTSTPEARKQVQTQNRWRQMQAPSVVYPALRSVTAATDVCEIDLLRPATVETPKHLRFKRVSEHAEWRWLYGRDRKQNFYQDEMRRADPDSPINTDLGYSQDFEDLCGDSVNWGNLRDKMALIYVDGNKFGAIGQNDTTSVYSRYSNELRKAQAAILRQLITQKAALDPDWQVIDQEKKRGLIRLETLLWGGDEVIWLVPAWKGWELLEFFFDEWTANASPPWLPESMKYPLTFTAALIFCHQKTPIHSVRDLASDLVTAMKKVNEKDPYKNRFVYQVLESFDYVTDPTGCVIHQSLPADKMKLLRKLIREGRENISRKKLYTIRKNPGETAAIAPELRKALPPDSPPAVAEIGEPCFWHHITELWDFVAPEKSDI
jgi:hypothetical protein